MGDETMAEALRIAERHLVKLGWKFTPRDVAERAREMLEVLAHPAATDQGGSNG